MTVSLNEAAQLNPDSQCAGGDKTALPLLGTNYNYNRRRAFLPCLKARGLQPEDFDDYFPKDPEDDSSEDTICYNILKSEFDEK